MLYGPASPKHAGDVVSCADRASGTLLCSLEREAHDVIVQHMAAAFYHKGV